MNLPKVLSLVLAVAVILNFVGLGFHVIKPEAFWLVVIISAVTAYQILPKLKKKIKAHGEIRTPE